MSKFVGPGAKTVYEDGSNYEIDSKGRRWRVCVRGDVEWVEWTDGDAKRKRDDDDRA